MNEATEAVVVLSKCAEVHKTYGIRAEKKAPGRWCFTWAFPIKESSAKREGYDRTSIGGHIDFTEEYPGCPYCGQIGFVACSCGHLSCNITKNGLFTCEWCGGTGTLGGYCGGTIKAGSDL